MKTTRKYTLFCVLKEAGLRLFHDFLDFLLEGLTTALGNVEYEQFAMALIAVPAELDSSFFARTLELEVR